jgi:beta-fructofuranosidase
MHYTSPSTGLFHVGYLHEGASGATTSSFVTYSDLNPDSTPFIRAGGINDPIAVFDGSVIEKGTPTLLYISVSYLPIQWTIPYTKESETQSLAIERDGGSNFTKLQHGPVIPGAPFAVNVTGFRDPYVFQSPQVDRLLAKQNGTWYTIISGGVHGEGPSIFLYAQYERDPDFQTWEYLVSGGMKKRIRHGRKKFGQDAGASTSKLGISSLWTSEVLILRVRSLSL